MQEGTTKTRTPPPYPQKHLSQPIVVPPSAAPPSGPPAPPAAPPPASAAAPTAPPAPPAVFICLVGWLFSFFVFGGKRRQFGGWII